MDSDEERLQSKIVIFYQTIFWVKEKLHYDYDDTNEFNAVYHR